MTHKRHCYGCLPDNSSRPHGKHRPSRFADKAGRFVRSPANTLRVFHQPWHSVPPMLARRQARITHQGLGSQAACAEVWPSPCCAAEGTHFSMSATPSVKWADRKAHRATLCSPGTKSSCTERAGSLVRGRGPPPRAPGARTRSCSALRCPLKQKLGCTMTFCMCGHMHGARGQS